MISSCVNVHETTVLRFLHSEAFYAVAQKKYVFIYDQNGVEVQ